MRAPDQDKEDGPAAALVAETAPVRAALGTGRYADALAACERLVESHGEEPVLLRLQGKALDGLGDYDAALALARRAVELRPRNVRARLRLARCLWRCGEPDAARAEADRVARGAGARVGALLRAGDFYAEIGADDRAWRCRLQALERVPEDAAAMAAVGDSAAARGQGGFAESHYDQALFHDPSALVLLERRSRLRRRSEADHRAAQLGYTLDRLLPDDPTRAPVCYALARELEDLGHAQAAFDIYSEGARCRLLGLAEAPAAGREAFGLVEAVFDATWLNDLPDGAAGSRRVFVSGLPCGGHRRLGALLDALPGVSVLREHHALEHAVTRSVGACASRPERWRAARDLPADALADAYARAVGRPSDPDGVLVDLSPLPAGFLGLARLAFPGAKLIHLRRDPRDHCLDLFTTLFARGLAWSYDLDALARTYAAHHQLMGHWRRHLPGGLLDLDLERLVDAPGEVAAELAVFLGLPIEGAFGQPEPWGPADSEDGVRGLAAGRWKAFETPLRPLAERLRADGVPVG